ncbi:MAG: glycosyltransferase [Gammaproteobacteria bacterium]
MKRLLMVAFHFPPLAGSSGIQRTLRFARYLPDNGWEPVVLTAHPRAYERTSGDQMQDIAPSLRVVRAQAWDTARHFAFGGRYIGALARPDRWLSWKYDAIRQGMRLIRELRPAAIWSTYPIATAHLIGLALHQRSGLPWIADFRDPMAQAGYPADRATWKQFKSIETQAADYAAAMVFTTPGACDEYRQRYPQAAARIHLIENGYDEAPFRAIVPDAAPLVPGRLTLLHSGIVYPSERDPRPLFDALAELKATAPELAARLHVRLRACAHEAFVNEELARRDIADLVEPLPPIPYREALEEMCRADALLVMQAANCNAQIPAKLYEYFRAGRPLIGLTDPAGDTARTLQAAGVSAIAPLDDSAAIQELLLRYMKAGATDDFTPDATYVTRCSREARTAACARLLEQVA